MTDLERAVDRVLSRSVEFHLAVGEVLKDRSWPPLIRKVIRQFLERVDDLALVRRGEAPDHEYK